MDLIGRELGRYRLVGLVGRGGMGAVYRARDTVLRRDVAVKVLADPTTGGRRLERFRREAQSVAQLSHPNILAIHDYGEHDGISYAVTELLEGEDLGRRLRRGPLPVAQAVELGAAVAEGLGEAHRHGVIHRDVKPRNLFVTAAGEVKILDFGLARSAGCETGDDTASLLPDLTSEGAVVGTAAYMSPEQARGAEVDHRTDVFSLGTVLYEALTGVHPFRTDRGPADTMTAILRDDPPPPSAVRPEIPAPLDGIVLRCLAKEPDDRFGSARDLAFALRSSSQTGSAAPVHPLKSRARPSWRGRIIAVAALVVVTAVVAGTLAIRRWTAPAALDASRVVVTRFESARQVPEFMELAAGITEVVAAGIEDLATASDHVAWVRPQLAHHRTPRSELGRAARQFDPTVAITGAVDRQGSTIGLTLAAVEPATGQTVRRIPLDLDLGNPRPLQVEPVERAAQLLGLAFPPEIRDRLEADASTLTAAVEAFLIGSGRAALAEGPEGLEAAIERLEASVEADPLYLPPRLAIGRTCVRAYEATGDVRWLERGAAAMADAAEIAPEDPRPAVVAAAVANAGGDVEEAAAKLERAVASAPSDPEIRVRLARALHRLGRVGDAERHLEHAMFLRPGYWPDHHLAATLHMAEGRYDAAVNEFRRVVELAPRYLGGYTNLGAMYAYLEQPQRAREVFERSLEVEPDDNYAAYANLGTLAFADGRYADAASMFERALEIEAGDYTVWGNLGFSYLWRGDAARAETPLRRATAMAEETLERNPDDPSVLSDLAGYYAATGREADGRDAVARAASLGPEDPQVVANIAEAFEYNGLRSEAMDWVEKALVAGVAPTRFERVPALRELVAESRYREMVAAAGTVP